MDDAHQVDFDTSMYICHTIMFCVYFSDLDYESIQCSYRKTHFRGRGRVPPCRSAGAAERLSRWSAKGNNNDVVDLE